MALPIQKTHFVVVVLAVFMLGMLAVYSKLVFIASSQKPPAYQALSEDLFIRGEQYFNQIESEVPYDIEKAKQAYEQFLAEGGENPFVHYQLGRIYFIQGDFERALTELTTQYEKYGDGLSNVHYMLGLTYGFKARAQSSKEDWARAESSFKDFIRLHPTAPWSRVDLSWVYFSQGKFDEIIPLVTEGLVYTPNNPWLHNMYGLALLNTGKKAEAREQFLLAQQYAAPLTVEDWGRSYPGNDPALWDEGLAEFHRLIEKNIALTEGV